MTFKTVNSIAFYLHYWKGAKQYGLLYLAVKDVKDVERYLLSGTLKHRQEIMSFVSTQLSYCLIMNPGKWMQIT
jgi:hypothetical protein